MGNKQSKFAQVSALIKKTDKENPKPEDLAELRKFLDQDSALVKANELNQKAFDRLSESISPSALMKEIIARQIKEKREALEFETANAFVKMLIDQVILCNIRLNQLEITHTTMLQESHTLTLGIYYDKRLSSAQRRFTLACESLAKVKKILSEANLRDQQARNKKSQSTLASQKLYKMLTD